jgi:hypothetical protein
VLSGDRALHRGVLVNAREFHIIWGLSTNC